MNLWSSGTLSGRPRYSPRLFLLSLGVDIKKCARLSVKSPFSSSTITPCSLRYLIPFLGLSLNREAPSNRICFCSLRSSNTDGGRCVFSYGLVTFAWNITNLSGSFITYGIVCKIVLLPKLTQVRCLVHFR